MPLGRRSADVALSISRSLEFLFINLCLCLFCCLRLHLRLCVCVCDSAFVYLHFFVFFAFFPACSLIRLSIAYMLTAGMTVCLSIRLSLVMPLVLLPPFAFLHNYVSESVCLVWSARAPSRSLHFVKFFARYPFMSSDP